MIVVSPVRSDEHLKLPRHNLCEVMKSIGTDAYGQSCLLFLEQSLKFRAEDVPSARTIASEQEP